MILITCGYQMDLGKDYTTNLTNKDISNYLKSYNVEQCVIDFFNENIRDIEGNVSFFTNKADAECICLDTGNSLYLVFIGTQFDLNDKVSLGKDLYTDLALGLKSISFLNKSIKIHEKYMCNMKNEDLIKKIIKVVSDCSYDNIFICGHSMGCGLGLYTSLVLTQKFNYKKFVFVSIESPKLGNLQLKKYIKKIKNLKHYDMINNNDIVPLYPFIYPNYCYVGYKTWLFDSEGNIKIKKNIKRNIIDNHSISDHFTNNILLNIYKSIKYL
jgi:hypothetical protein